MECEVGGKQEGTNLPFSVFNLIKITTERN